MLIRAHAEQCIGQHLELPLELAKVYGRALRRLEMDRASWCGHRDIITISCNGGGAIGSRIAVARCTAATFLCVIPAAPTGESSSRNIAGGLESCPQRLLVRVHFYLKGSELGGALGCCGSCCGSSGFERDLCV